MLEKTLATLGLMLALQSSAAILDLGRITRDTGTGLDWLDLTETNGRSYIDVSSKLEPGMEFQGYRYATRDEVQVLWQNLGLPHGTNIPVASYEDVYPNFLSAVALLGDTLATIDNHFGSAGITGTEAFGIGIPAQYIAGMYRISGPVNTRIYDYDNTTDSDNPQIHLGSYLVKKSPIPLPASAWLLGSSLLFLARFKRPSQGVK